MPRNEWMNHDAPDREGPEEVQDQETTTPVAEGPKRRKSLAELRREPGASTTEAFIARLDQASEHPA